jgi:hypothetical protein
MTDTTNKKLNAAAQLIDQVKSYVLLEKKYLTIDASEKVTKLISWLLLTLILIGVGLLVFMLFLMTLIHLMAYLFGSITIAYAVATLICVAVFAFVWFRKDALIVQPVTRAIEGFLESTPDPDADPEQVAALAQLPDDKNELRHSIRLMEKDMKISYDRLIAREPKKDQTLGERLGLYVDRGMLLYRSVMFSLGFINILRGKNASKAKKGVKGAKEVKGSKNLKDSKS